LRGVSKDRHERLWPILRGSPRCGEHLRMTVVFEQLFLHAAAGLESRAPAATP